MSPRRDVDFWAKKPDDKRRTEVVSCIDIALSWYRAAQPPLQYGYGHQAVLLALLFVDPPTVYNK
jgi:hypothetical protein